MHRKTIYIGQIPLELDLLDAEQFAMVALAKLTEAVLGTGPFVDGLQLAPTTPASLNVNLGAGTIFQLENLEQSVWSSLPADLSHSIVKQGILLDAVTLGITPPVTVGYSQVFLIQVQYQDLDTAPQVLPYYNSDFPDVPFSGPEGTGDEQNTVREGIVAVELKAGIASATGTQTAPAADAGWTALWTVTVANGATTITSGNISAVANAPWIDPKLPQVPAAVQSGKWLYAANTGTANNLVATYSPVPAVLTVGMVLRVFVGNAPNSSAMTFNPNGFGASSIVKADGSNMLPGDIQPGMFLELEWTGTTWQAVNFRGSTNKGLVGAANNLKGSSTGAKTALWTADEFVVGSTGGGFMYKVTPFTLSFDGSTTGAGGMDTGVLTGPADICVYAIFSPAAGTLATLGCLSSASNAPWYTGTHVPAGFTMSGLIYTGRTDGSANLVSFLQTGRRVSILPVQLFDIGSAGATALTAQSIAVACPGITKNVTGWLFAGSLGSSGTVPMVASSAAGHNGVQGSGSAGFIGNYQPTTEFYDLPIVTTQTMYWKTGSADTGTDTSLWIGGYQF